MKHNLQSHVPVLFLQSFLLQRNVSQTRPLIKKIPTNPADLLIPFLCLHTTDHSPTPTSSPPSSYSQTSFIKTVTSSKEKFQAFIEFCFTLPSPIKKKIIDLADHESPSNSQNDTNQPCPSAQVLPAPVPAPVSTPPRSPVITSRRKRKRTKVSVRLNY